MTVPSPAVTTPSPVSPPAALAGRLQAVAQVLLPQAAPAADQDPARRAGQLLDELVRHIAVEPAKDAVWLLLTAIAGAFPTRDEVDAAHREFALSDPMEMALYLLENGTAAEVWNPLAEIDVVVGAAVVDVDHTAKHDLHTGIQRVTRSFLPVWSASHPIVLAAWSDNHTCLRTLTAEEGDRVLKWGQEKTQAATGPAGSPQERPRRALAKFGRSTSGQHHEVAPATHRLLVPWRSVVVLAEVPPAAVNDRIAAIGAYSGNRVTAIGYDTIPVVSADMVPMVESTKFVRYLSAIKFSTRVAGISAAAAGEIAGFVAALPTQGLTGPDVVEVRLPDPAPFASSKQAPAARPMVLVVGSNEPRKNHLAVLHSAELLWRDGLEFSLLFIGGSGWGEEFPRRVADLQASGRAVEVRRGVGEEELLNAYATARFSVFPSLHEGYGLPVAESLSHGLPVITSNFGSTAEIAADGGVLPVDPRSDEAITEAMRTLLTDDGELDRLREEITRRPGRTWTAYADELWSALVKTVLTDLAGSSRGGRA